MQKNRRCSERKMFNPKITIGDELTNKELRVLFQCGNMGGMRRSKKTGSLVIVSDHTKGLYQMCIRDRGGEGWRGGYVSWDGAC